MSVVRNSNWYALNATRKAPVDDAATARDDNGAILPSQILADCYIRWPSTYGDYLFVSAVAVTPRLVTVCFSSSFSPAVRTQTTSSSSNGDPAVGSPIAAVTLLKSELVAYRQYAVTPLVEGAGGWAVFGAGTDELYSGRFQDVAQSMLLPRCARSYTPLPIPSIGKLYVDPPLTGIVSLQAGTDIAIERGERLVDGVIRDAIIIRLDNTLNRNILDKYKGPCGGRPESYTCIRPGIERINNAVPDANGNIELEFLGVTVYDLWVGSGGQAVALALGLSDVCTRSARLPDDDGNLPGQPEDQCEDTDSSLSETVEEEEEPDLGCDGLPFTESFDSIDPAWDVKVGTWTVRTDDDSPDDPSSGTASLFAANPSRRNTIIWDGCAHDETNGKLAQVGIKLLAGTYRNGGIVFNHTVDANGDERYFLALLNKDTDAIELRLFSCGRLSEPIDKMHPLGLSIDRWYDLQVEITWAGGSNPVVIEITLRESEGGAVIGTFSVETLRYTTLIGKFGVSTNYASAMFGFFRLVEA